MWTSGCISHTNEELVFHIGNTKKDRVIVLDGPASCGKTQLIRSISNTTNRYVEIFSSESIAEYLNGRFKTPAYYRFIPCVDIFVIDDVDLLKYQRYQVETAYLIKQILREHLVILSGTKVLERLPLLICSLEQDEVKIQFWGYSG